MSKRVLNGVTQQHSSLTGVEMEQAEISKGQYLTKPTYRFQNAHKQDQHRLNGAIISLSSSCRKSRNQKEMLPGLIC